MAMLPWRLPTARFASSSAPSKPTASQATSTIEATCGLNGDDAFRARISTTPFPKSNAVQHVIHARFDDSDTTSLMEDPTDVSLDAATTASEIILSNGHPIYYVTHGPPNASQTFFLIHGSAGSHRSFAQLAPLLVQDDFNVVAVDVPGHGSTSGDAAGGDLDLTDARVARAM
ncbi:hypothetical protein As57867_008762, partial [Aphanomyces stellatus]